MASTNDDPGRFSANRLCISLEDSAAGQFMSLVPLISKSLFFVFSICDRVDHQFRFLSLVLSCRMMNGRMKERMNE